MNLYLERKGLIYLKKKNTPPLFINRPPVLHAGIHTVNAGYPVAPHRHTFYEIELVLSGTGYTVINDVTYPLKKGIFTLITPWDTHSIFADEKLLCAKISFEKEFIENLEIRNLLANTDLSVFEPGIEEINYFHANFSMLSEICTSTKSINILHSRLILEALILFTISRGNQPVTHTPSSQMQKALEFIENNFTNNITLSDAAKISYISEGYFSSRFHEETGISFSNYLLNKRLMYARKLLASKTINMTDVATISGFNSPSYFSRAFKKMFGISPAAYRKQLKDKTIES